MMPVILRIGGYQLTSYVALIALAGIASLFYFKRFESKLGLARPEDFWILVNVIGFSGFLGARLFDLFSGPVVFVDARDFFAALVSNQGGLSTFGALLGVLIGTVAAGRYLGLSVLRVSDYVCLAIPVGHAIARLGCLLNGCCYGREAGDHLAWSVVFTNRSAALPPELLGVPLHPVQIYEATGDLLLAGTLYFLVLPCVGKGRFGPGLVSAAYAAGYGVLRYVGENFRGQPLPVLEHHRSVPAGQIFALTMILAAAVFMFLAARQRTSAMPQPSASS